MAQQEQPQLVLPQLPLPAALNAPLDGIEAPGPVPYGQIPNGTLLADEKNYKNVDGAGLVTDQKWAVLKRKTAIELEGYLTVQSAYRQAGAPAWAIALQNSVSDMATTMAQHDMRNTARTQNRFAYQQDVQQAALTPLPAVRSPPLANPLPANNDVYFPSTVGAALELTHNDLNALAGFYGVAFNAINNIGERRHQFKLFITLE